MMLRQSSRFIFAVETNSIWCQYHWLRVLLPVQVTTIALLIRGEKSHSLSFCVIAFAFDKLDKPGKVRHCLWGRDYQGKDVSSGTSLAPQE